MNRQNEEQKTEEKTFLQKHGWKIVGGVVVIAGSIFVGKKLGQKGMIPMPKNNFTLIDWGKGGIGDMEDLIGEVTSSGKISNKIQNLEIPNIISAHVDDLWKEGDDVLGIMHDVMFQDLGKFGKELKDKIPELKDKDFVHFPCIGFTKYNAD